MSAENTASLIHLTQERLHQASTATDHMLSSLLPDSDMGESRLYDAMRYGTFNGGKRIRPFLLLSTAQIFDVNAAQALRAAAAIEMIHAYSLIHDDLPCMDDAELRRGKKTVHRAFDEHTALLAGDALLPLAFEILADQPTHEDAVVRCLLVEMAARAAGGRGMVAGQMLDLLAENQELDWHHITRLQRLKTGAIIGFCCEAGAVMGYARDSERAALLNYAHDIGLAYQIIDDILDAEGEALTLGKPVGSDAVRGKATFVSLLGLDRARAQAELLSQQAISHLDIFDNNADALRDLVPFLIKRRY